MLITRPTAIPASTTLMTRKVLMLPPDSLTERRMTCRSTDVAVIVHLANALSIRIFGREHVGYRGTARTPMARWCRDIPASSLWRLVRPGDKSGSKGAQFVNALSRRISGGSLSDITPQPRRS